MSRSFAFRAAAGALLSLLVLAGVAPAAAARPDPGDVGWSRVDLEPTNCPLRRIDTQLVRCDSLTGAGVPAPLFIAELQALGEVGSSHVDIEPTRCPLRRIDTQLVRCDSLTGAGVPAPLFIPELRPLAASGR